MSSSPRVIALHLRKLCSDPISQAFICQEVSCMSGLLALLSSPSSDVDVLLISLQALLFLASHPSNQQPLTRQSALILRLTSLLEHDDSRVGAMVQQILDQLQAVVNRDQRGDGQRGMGGTGRGGGRVRGAAASSAAAPRYLHSVCLQVERASADGCLCPAELSGEERAKVERSLIVQRAIISVSVTRAGAVTLYTKQDTQQLIDIAHSGSALHRPRTVHSTANLS